MSVCSMFHDVVPVQVLNRTYVSVDAQFKC